MKQSQRIVKNALFGIASSVIGGGVYLATIVTFARAVSVTEFGKYSFVLAFAMFVSNIADSGLPRMLIREISVGKLFPCWRGLAHLADFGCDVSPGWGCCPFYTSRDRYETGRSWNEHC
jgi:hypothetical protein